MNPNEHEHNAIAEQARERYTYEERVENAREWLRAERGRLIGMSSEGVDAPTTVAVSGLTFGLSDAEMSDLRAEMEGDDDA